MERKAYSEYGDPDLDCTFIDCCTSDYLTDHHNRDGECLVGVQLGQSKEEAANEVLNYADIPETFSDERIRAAARRALKTITLVSNGESEDCLVWLLFKWNPSEVKL